MEGESTGELMIAKSEGGGYIGDERITGTLAGGGAASSSSTPG